MSGYSEIMLMVRFPGKIAVGALHPIKARVVLADVRAKPVIDTDFLPLRP